jgi:hypothetical protein
MKETRMKDRYTYDNSEREEASAVEEESVEEKSRLSRVSRHQPKKQMRTKNSEKQAGNKYGSALKACSASVLRYLRYFYMVMKSPLAAMRQADEIKAKYGYVSLALFAVFFSMGNFIQLQSSKERMLGFGVSHPFLEAFFIVLLFVFGFLLVSAGSIWLVSKYAIRNPLPLQDIVNRLSVLIVPVVMLTFLWVVFSIPNVILLTSILSVLGFCYYLFSIYALIEFVYQCSDRPAVDLYYCAGIVLLIMIICVTVVWGFLSDYLLSSLIPI